MAQIVIRQRRIQNLRLPKEYDPNKIQIGIPVSDDEDKVVGLVAVGDTILPPAEYGATCRRNAYGYSYPDKTKPKVNRYISTNLIQPFGNENASSVAVDVYRRCYPRIDVDPTEIEIALFEDKKNSKFIVANLTPSLRKVHLKEAVNIFLEIYGFCYIFCDEIAIEQTMKRHRCNWEMLPPGEKSSTHLTRQFREQGRNIQCFDIARLNILENYKAEQIVEGINGFRGYYAYIFQHYCVLESAVYGNATYIIPKENWEVLSQKTKQELLDAKLVVEKIIHTKMWENTIRRSFNRLKIQ